MTLLPYCALFSIGNYPFFLIQKTIVHLHKSGIYHLNAAPLLLIRMSFYVVMWQAITIIFTSQFHVNSLYTTNCSLSANTNHSQPIPHISGMGWPKLVLACLLLSKCSVALKLSILNHKTFLQPWITKCSECRFLEWVSFLHFSKHYQCHRYTS